jgi:NADPH:quinone reductase-like Zn-dependent oxidoreductase
MMTQAHGFKPGDQVWCNSLGHDGRQGSFARFAVVPAEREYHLPSEVDPVTAVAAAHPAATAYLAWFVHAGLRPGQTVYVGGAAGNVGTAAVQMATTAGARVIAGARPADHAPCAAAGAAATVDFQDRGSPADWPTWLRTASTCSGTPPPITIWMSRCTP